MIVREVIIMEEAKDPLDALFVEKDQVSNELLRDLLVGFVQLTNDGLIIAKPEFTSLSNRKKILVILLAKKVLKLKMEFDEATAGTEIIKVTGLTRGSVYPMLRQLEGERLVASKDGKYWVPNFALGSVKELFSR